MKAIPTIYKEIVFRSQLEARWAYFFDSLGWHWEYEPFIELDGWIPDFIIFGKNEDVLVEIKPYYERIEWVETINKIEKSIKNIKNKREIVLCGGSLIYEENFLSLGFFLEQDKQIIEPLAIFIDGSTIGFSSQKDFICKISDKYDGEPLLSNNESIVLLWNKTSLVTRWNAPKPASEDIEIHKIKSLGLPVRIVRNGKTYHYKIKKCNKVYSLYPPLWKIKKFINSNSVPETIESDSFKTALEYIKND